MSRAKAKYEKALASATSYDQWYEAALELDKLDKLDQWRDDDASEEYDHRLIASRVRLLRKLRKDRNFDLIIFRLREELHGNLGNMANPAMYQHARTGTKKLVNQYLDEVCAAVTLLTESNVKTLPPMRKRRFLKRSARSFGRSALLLSGGAALGMFHLGVIQELEKQGILPRVITGSSSGSIIAGVLATHTDDEMEALLNRKEWKFEWVRRYAANDVLKQGALLDQQLLRKAIDLHIPDMTFLEAYEHTNRILNISVSPADSNQFPRLLNYLTAPNVLIRRAALASAAIPGIFPPVQLRAKNFAGKSVVYMPQSYWIDGSVHEDIPKEKVNRLHNVNHYIVSQTNPHIVPFLSEEMEETGLLPFIQDVLIKAPIVQIEHLLELVQQHFHVPGLSSVIKKAHAVARQNYSGDITIYPERNIFSLTRLFNNLGPEELETLMMEGRRATWPKIERIRNTTQISRTFDSCLRHLSETYRYVKR
jgi:predicted acylesterase/phospholipase RssA